MFGVGGVQSSESFTSKSHFLRLQRIIEGVTAIATDRKKKDFFVVLHVELEVRSNNGCVSPQTQVALVST